MNNIKTIENKQEWNKYLDKMFYSDFYYTHDYHQLSVELPNRSVLFAYEEAEYCLIIPLIIRPINNEQEIFDATSVYGYAGPLSSHQEIPSEILKNFQIALKNKLLELNIISVFSRLHPYFENDKLISELEIVESLSQTVYIDLKIPQEEQYKQYRKAVKYPIKALIRDGFTVFEDKELNYLDDFISFYNENMSRVNAAPMYFFSEDYYRTFFNSKEIGAKLFLVKKEDTIVAGSIIVFSKSVIQYHLSATKTDFLKDSPMRLLLDHIRRKYSGQEQDVFFLGGGVGSANDSLFNFKAGFSKSRPTFKIWKYIVNQKIYQELNKKAGITEEERYFPAYRANNKIL